MHTQLIYTKKYYSLMAESENAGIDFDYLASLMDKCWHRF